MKNILKLSLMTVVTGIILSGCSNQVDITSAELKSIESSAPVIVDKIPQFNSVQLAEYEVSKLRSPFFSETMFSNLNTLSEKKVNINVNRKLGPLEEFDISLLQMPGVFRKNGVLSGLIQTPNGDVVVVKVGDYLGVNHGRITLITNSTMEILEAIPDGLGGYLGQPVSLNVTENQPVKN